MSNVRIARTEIAAAGETLRASAEEIAERTRLLDAALRELQGQWQGTGAEAFFAEWDAHLPDLKAMPDDLETEAAQLGNVRGGFDRAEQKAARRFRNS